MVHINDLLNGANMIHYMVFPSLAITFCDQVCFLQSDRPNFSGQRSGGPTAAKDPEVSSTSSTDQETMTDPNGLAQSHVDCTSLVRLVHA